MARNQGGIYYLPEFPGTALGAPGAAATETWHRRQVFVRAAPKYSGRQGKIPQVIVERYAITL